MPTVTELGQRVKQKYPGAYDKIDDAELGRQVKAKFPGGYDQFEEPAPPEPPPAWAPPDLSQTEVKVPMDQPAALKAVVPKNVKVRDLPGVGETIGRGLMQGLTLGTVDKLQAAARAGQEEALAKDPEVGPLFEGSPKGPSYEEELKSEEYRTDYGKSQNPTAAAISEAAGSAPLAALAPIEGVGPLTRAISAAKQGAKLGLASGVGHSRTAEDIIPNAVAGAAGGAMAGGTLQPLGEALVTLGGVVGRLALDRTGKLVFRRLTGSPEGAITPEQTAIGVDAYQADKGYPRGLFPQTTANVEKAKGIISAQGQEARQAISGLRNDAAVAADETFKKLITNLDETQQRLSRASTPEQVQALSDKVSSLESEIDDVRDAILSSGAAQDAKAIELYQEMFRKLAIIKAVLNKNKPEGITTQVGKKIKSAITNAPVTGLSNIPTIAAQSIESKLGINPLTSPTANQVFGQSLAGGAQVTGQVLQQTPSQRLLAEYLRKKIEEQNKQQSLR